MTEDEQKAMIEQIRAQQAAAQAAAAGPTVSAEAGPVAAPADAAVAFDENDQTTWGTPGRNEPCPAALARNLNTAMGA